jgi:hypothetical protein
MITSNHSVFRSPGPETCFDQPTRAVRTRMLRGVGGGSCEAPPYPDVCRALARLLNGDAQYYDTHIGQSPDPA